MTLCDVMSCRVTCAPGRHPSHTPFCRDSDCCGTTSTSLERRSRAILIKVCTTALCTTISCQCGLVVCEGFLFVWHISVINVLRVGVDGIAPKILK